MELIALSEQISDEIVRANIKPLRFNGVKGPRTKIPIDFLVYVMMDIFCVNVLLRSIKLLV
jgi:hypothetical protein